MPVGRGSQDSAGKTAQVAPLSVGVTAEIEADLRTVRCLNAIRGRDLLADHGFLQGSLGPRNPYVDPLSLLQVSLLKTKRTWPKITPIAPCWSGRWGPR